MRWSRQRIARVEQAKLNAEIEAGEHQGLSERELDRLFNERIEDAFGELSDRLYDEARDREMERNYERDMEP